MKSLASWIAVFAVATLWPVPLMEKTVSTSRSTATIVKRVAHDFPHSIVTQDSRARSLATAMQQAKVPGVSVAVFVDGRLAWSQAWGVMRLGEQAPVTPATLFQAASISKPVTALTAMTMVADGRLALDRDVSHAIEGWSASAPITLRQLLSHSAGLNVSGFEGYVANAPVPTPQQILRGDPPSNTPKVVVEHVPGQAFNYSGGGYTVVQTLMSQTAAKAFSEIIAERVLRPMGMTESIFEQPLPAELRAGAASGHRDGKAVVGGSHTYPELAAAGLWTTPRDIGKVAVDIQNAYRGVGASVATPTISRDMQTPQIGGHGLGFELKTLHGEPVFEHTGLNEGFEARLVASPNTMGPRYVVVVMTNGQGGTAIADGIIRAIAREYQWRAFAPQSVRRVALPKRDRAKFEGFYRGAGRAIGIELKGSDLYVRDDGWRPARMIATSPSAFVVENRPGVYRIGTNVMSGASTLKIDEAGPSAAFVKSKRLLRPEDGGSVFLRGSMNDWQTTVPFEQTGADAMTAMSTLAAGSHEFKIGDHEWWAVNLGARFDEPSLTLGSAASLGPMGGNLSFNAPVSGRYRFVISALRSARPSIVVTRVAP